MPDQRSSWQKRPGVPDPDPTVVPGGLTAPDPVSHVAVTPDVPDAGNRTSTRPERVSAPVRRTRAGAAWVGIAVGALVLVLLIVFMLQNTAPVEVAFFGLRGSAPLALTLLIAGVGVGIVALAIGSLRIAQLRRRIGLDRQDAAHSHRTAL